MKVKIINKSGFDLPEYATSQSAGIDIKAKLKEDEWDEDDKYRLEPGERILIKTGLYLELPNNIEAQVRPRSGLAYKNGITIVNSPGTVDADYRGEIGIILINHGQSDFVIKHGDRIAQLVFAEYKQVEFEEVKELSETERGAGGFGSSGN